MKKTLILALGGVVLALGACAAPETPAEAPKTSESLPALPTTSESVAPVLTESTAESDRVDQILASVMKPEGFYLSDGLYYQYAVLVCDGLSDDLDPMDIARIGAETFDQYSLDQHAMMVGASVGGLCPEHSDIITNY